MTLQLGTSPIDDDVSSEFSFSASPMHRTNPPLCSENPADSVIPDSQNTLTASDTTVSIVQSSDELEDDDPLMSDRLLNHFVRQINGYRRKIKEQTKTARDLRRQLEEAKKELLEANRHFLDSEKFHKDQMNRLKYDHSLEKAKIIEDFTGLFDKHEELIAKYS